MPGRRYVGVFSKNLSGWMGRSDQCVLSGDVLSKRVCFFYLLAHIHFKHVAFWLNWSYKSHILSDASDCILRPFISSVFFFLKRFCLFIFYNMRNSYNSEA